jgi:hypothetical protein
MASSLARVLMFATSLKLVMFLPSNTAKQKSVEVKVLFTS